MKNQIQTFVLCCFLCNALVLMGCTSLQIPGTGNNNPVINDCGQTISEGKFIKKFAVMPGGKNATLTINELIAISIQQKEQPTAEDKKELERLNKIYNTDYRILVEEIIGRDIPPRCPVNSYWWKPAFDNVILFEETGYENISLVVYNPDGKPVGKYPADDLICSESGNLRLFQMKQTGEFPSGEQVTVKLNCTRKGKPFSYSCLVAIGPPGKKK